jgi:hypothetical protein
MKSKEKIDELAEEFLTFHQEGSKVYHIKIREAIEFAYNKCQEDTKQILLDFIKWSNAVDEYGNKLDNVDIDNFFNKQD